MTAPDTTRIAWSLEEVPAAPSVVTIGFFDGVHRGHQTIIRRAVGEASRRSLRSVAVTFDRHPMEVVRPGSQPRLLQSLPRRVATLLDQGVDLVLALPFTEELSKLAPQDFVERVLAGPLRARKVVVGSNFRFGHKAAGDVVTLTDLGAGLDFEVEGVTLLDLDGVTISSTEVRERVDAGDVEWAERALGRPHLVEGPVVRGDGRGASIGVPTANVEVDRRLQVPAGGVYAGYAHRLEDGDDVLTGVDPVEHPCVVNIGTRPTFGGVEVTVEAHLLDTVLDLYGSHLAVAFTARLRDERRFDGPDELVAQIHADIARAREDLEAHG